MIEKDDSFEKATNWLFFEWKVYLNPHIIIISK